MLEEPNNIKRSKTLSLIPQPIDEIIGQISKEVAGSFYVEKINRGFEVSSVVKDVGGKVVEGDPRKIKKQKDTWTFFKNFSKKEPNWVFDQHQREHEWPYITRYQLPLD